MAAMMDMRRLQRWGTLLGVTLAVTAGLVLLDRLADPDPAGRAELAVDLFETFLLVGAMTVVARLVVRLDGVERETYDIRLGLEHARREGEAWRRQSSRLMAGLSEAISAQFDRWELTAAEADIAGLMLKGLPMRDIAKLRRTNEATIRQQAQGVYRKSGLSGRAELAAYFLEDLYDVAHGDRRGLPGAALN